MRDYSVAVPSTNVVGLRHQYAWSPMGPMLSEFTCCVRAFRILFDSPPDTPLVSLERLAINDFRFWLGQARERHSYASAFVHCNMTTGASLVFLFDEQSPRIGYSDSHDVLAGLITDDLKRKGIPLG